MTFLDERVRELEDAASKHQEQVKRLKKHMVDARGKHVTQCKACRAASACVVRPGVAHGVQHGRADVGRDGAHGSCPTPRCGSRVQDAEACAGEGNQESSGHRSGAPGALAVTVPGWVPQPHP